MKTIKLPITPSNKDYIISLQKQQSAVIRYSYKRFKESKSEKEIRSLCKSLNNIDLLNSWLIQSAIKEGKQIHTKNKENKVFFGGKNSFYDRLNNKITKKEWKEKRLLPIVIQGEAPQNGNRSFKFEVIENNTIIFKPNRNSHITLQLPKLRKNYKKELSKLQQLMENSKIPTTIKLTSTYIYVTYDEIKFAIQNYKPIKDRIASIDMNPNYIGFVIKDYNQNNIIYKEVISLKTLNDKYKQLKGLPSTDKRKVKLNNQRRYFVYEIAKYLTDKAKHYKCDTFVLEKLKLETKNHKNGRNFNRLVNNQWLRQNLVSNLNKRCGIAGITFMQVYPQYSSFIGCMNYPNETDSIAAAIELNRRGFKLKNYDKQKKTSVLYPDFNKGSLLNLWKNEAKNLILGANDWVSLYHNFKKSGLRYRFLIEDFIKKSQAVFKLRTKFDYINFYLFI